MSKGKLQKFAELETFNNVFQYPYGRVIKEGFPLRGRWREDYFGNSNPIVVELGCGKGEYTVELARLHPNMNFIGVDIKGARIYHGAKQALNEKLTNVAFVRTNIEFIDRFFDADEVEEIWLTFSDPQMKNYRKRLTSTPFLERYRHFLIDGGIINLKTDSAFLFTYTTLVIERNHLPLLIKTEDVHNDDSLDCQAKAVLDIQTYYERQWMERGIKIKYIKFQLTKDCVLTEPDIEIPLDEYRSYKRTKRSGLTMSK